MDYFIIAGGAVALVLITVALTIWLSRKPVGQTETAVETDLFKAATLAIKKLGDTTAEQEVIAAEQQRIALKNALMAQLIANLTTYEAPKTLDVSVK